MPSPPRILLPKSTVFITTRMQEGLPLIPAEFIKVILKGILGRAQTLYQVTPCHYLFMNNHFHLFLKVENPEDVAAFMDRVKTEIAHAVNRLLGRRQRTVWCDSYDAVPVLTVNDCIEKIAYIYTNPQKPGLVDRIEDYPGLSSWELYTNKKPGFVARWIRRPFIQKLAKYSLSLTEQAELAKGLTAKSKKRVVFRIYPDAWMDSFSISQDEERANINQRIMARVRELEETYIAKRKENQQRVVGPTQLKLQPIDKPYTPTRFGQRMWCICSDVDLRKSFITCVKSLLQKGQEVRARWLQGDFSEPYPLGLFPPHMPRLGNVMPGVLL